MDLIERIYRVYRLLRNARYPVPFSRIRRELEECSRSTAVRTIERMRNHLHAPIDYDRGRNGYYLRASEDGPWELPGLWFNASELHALLAAQELLANVQPGLLEEALAPLKERIEQLLKSRGGGGREVARRVRLVRTAARRVEPEHFRTAAAALIARQRLRIVYHARGRDEVTRREVSPQRLIHYRDNWYLDAWDHGKRALRHFAVERIHEPRLLDERAKDIPEERLNRYFTESYGIFSGRPKRKALLRFTPERARWVADERWHPQQKGWFEGEHYCLEIPYSDDRELVLDILKHGPEVEVLRPKSLRKKVLEQLLRAASQYRR